MSTDGNATPLREPGLPEVPEHRLLRCVGGGSYGEVWLAQNVNGHFRAIKVVNRSWFRGDDRPFEREYEGLCRFDPVSRRHPSQLPVLQIGRNDPAGYFYYVMEPADDVVTGAEIQPDTYLPKTLGRVLKDRGRLPLQELLPIALSLTDALDHLHRHQLVHRDIKPSNIIWHLGVPKLADIGLVTATGDGSTLVGTRGYFPDGGVVDASGDLFALGKVLYQAATGLEPSLFPRFPDNLPTDDARQELRELNEILFRACASDPEKRYRTASEMRRDLAALDAGKSLWKQRRRRRMAIGVAVLALLLLAVGTIARWLEPRPPPKPSQLPVAARPGSPADLIHWWPGDGDARDHVGNAHGTLHTNATFVPGRIGQAFSGVVEIPDQPDLNFRDGHPFTIALWAYSTNTSIRPQHLFGKRDEFSLSFQMAMDGRGLAFGPGGWAGAIVGTGLLPYQQWTHLAGVSDGKGTVRFLVNGAVAATGPGGFGVVSKAPLKLGGAGPYRPFAGYLDDVRIYNRALAPDELLALIRSAPDQSHSSAAAAWPRRWTNSLGQIFVPVPGTDVRFCIWHTRVQDYEVFAAATKRDWPNPGFPQGPTHPAVMVNWDDTQEFCRWLTARERHAGQIPAGASYRLPLDWEWSVAVGLNEPRTGTPREKDGKTRDVYPWGTPWPPPKAAGNYHSSYGTDDFDSVASGCCDRCLS